MSIPVPDYMREVPARYRSDYPPYMQAALAGFARPSRMPGELRTVADRLYIDNTPLGDASAQTGPGGSLDAAAGTPAAPIAVKMPGRYGDSVVIQVTFTGPGFSTLGSVVLARPNNKRAMLLIVNSGVIGNIYYAYDRDASAADVPIAAGGSRNYDSEAIPQGNLSLYSSGAGTAVVEYINVNI